MSQYNIFKSLKNQHHDILELAGKLSTLVEEEDQDFDSGIVCTELNKLKIELESHLKLEDELLYPLLSKNNKEEIRNTARQFSVEFSSLMENFMKYDGKWSLEASIADDRDGFISETKVVVEVLKARIIKENEELFVLIEGGTAR